MLDPKRPKKWEFRAKHRKATVDAWQASNAKAWSGERGGASQYNPLLYNTHEAVEKLELKCVKKGKLIQETESKQTFYLDANQTVGACSGEFTNYVFAEWHSGGSIHGRPISPVMLRRLGVQV